MLTLLSEPRILFSVTFLQDIPFAGFVLLSRSATVNRVLSFAAVSLFALSQAQNGFPDCTFMVIHKLSAMLHRNGMNGKANAFFWDILDANLHFVSRKLSRQPFIVSAAFSSAYRT